MSVPSKQICLFFGGKTPVNERKDNGRGKSFFIIAMFSIELADGWVEMWAMRLKTSISAIKIQQPASNWSFYVCFNFVTGFPMHEMALRVVASLIFEVLNFVIVGFKSISA